MRVEQSAPVVPTKVPESAASVASTEVSDDASPEITEKRRQDVAYVLNNPVFLEVSEPIRKMRSNLMIASMVAIFLITLGVGVGSGTSFAGVQFTGLTEFKISLGLLCVILYMLIHFVWSSWDGFQEWKIRCSGTRSAFNVPKAGADPRQASLMTWWTAQVNSVGAQQDSVNHCLAIFEKAIASTTEGAVQNTAEATKARHEMIQSFQAYSSGMMQLYKMGVSKANEGVLREQLQRFEITFKKFSISQNSRWISIEFATPVLVSVIAIGQLLTTLSWNPFFWLFVYLFG